MCERVTGGGRGVRTHETLLSTGFQDQLHRPLGQPSCPAKPTGLGRTFMGRTTILCRLATITHCPVALRVLSVPRSPWERLIRCSVGVSGALSALVAAGEDCAVVVGRGVLSAAVAV